jgi:hypothetical protein
LNSNKHTCVCSICGQGFTRKSSAIRHNNSLHNGQGMIVKPYDYIIGRIQGQFSPGDPRQYRRDLKNRTQSLVSDHHLPPDLQQPADPLNRPLYPQIGIPRSQPNQKSPHSSNRFLERKSKLDELQILLNRNFPQQSASQIIAQTTYLVNQGNNDAYLDSLLMSLRAISGSP